MKILVAPFLQQPSPTTPFNAFIHVNHVSTCCNIFFKSLVEDVLFPQVKEIVELQLDNQCQKDKMLEEKYKKFADVDQQTMGIKETFLDTRIHPHCKAITEIMKVNIVNSPTRKIRHILTAAHEIICYMNSLCGEDDMVPGAGE